ncbi:SCL-interrupting locus protein homolog isoform X2 [Melanotaenia boesemani]|uniref:SCL-interrupting locus protein homolog isoform X2 n=1 Tax=Melanotaenia boesemani TaxID=1250792 RepID=UPI001C0588E9|nr:SCL-interrupting locus protein homolog isoform X2 [Melanotaenia boesemani]
MSCPVKFQALPSGVFEEVFTPENIRGRTSVNSLTQLSFPKSRSALWDSTPAGEKLRLQLCSHRKPRVVLLEKALRLAQRHARHSNKPRLHCFFLGSVSIDSDEEGITVTLDRFDPGRDQAGASGRVPSAPLPGDVLVPCLFALQSEMTPEAVVQSEAELHRCFKALQQFVSSRQTLDLSQLLKIRVHVFCSQQSDAAAFAISWSSVCPAVSVDVQPVRTVPIIPTALLRSLTSVGRPLQNTGRQRGFLTMDQTRKLVLLLESDPKASSLPLVGLWLSGVSRVSNALVWAWCLRFMFSSALQDRVLSESGSFLLVVFGSTHRTPQFFQCRGSGPGPGPGPGLQLDFQLLTASQSATLYQVAPVEGRVLQCELVPEDRSRQTEVLRAAQTSFSSTPPPAAPLSISDQDSGVEDEDFSPRPSPSPHPPAPQTRQVQPLVPELSLLIDSSFSSNHSGGQDSSHRPPPPVRKPAPPAGPTCSSASKPPPPLRHFHSTPNSNLQPPSCTCCSTQNCTSIFPSPPALLPVTAPPSSPHHTPCPSHHSVPPPSFHQHTAPPNLPVHSPPASHRPTPLPNLHSAPPPPSSPHHPPLLPSSHQHTLPPSSNSPSSHPAPPSHHPSSPPPSLNPSTPLPTQHHTPPPSSRLSAPPPSTFGLPQAPSCPCFHPLPLPWHGDSPTPHPAHPAALDPVSPPWLPRPPCVNRCCDQSGGVAPPDTYQLLLHQDRQLRLLQAQVQMLLEAQRKLQSSSQQADTPTLRSTASVAVETGASLFWGSHPGAPLSYQEEQAPPSSSSNNTSPKPPPSSSSSPSIASHDLSVRRSEGGAEDADITGQAAPCSSSLHHSLSGLQSPVLGESVSMYGPAEEQQSFYHNLLTQLSSRLQESDSKQEAEEDSRRKSVSVSDHSQSSQSSSSSKRKQNQQSPEGDPVIRATLQQLQQLGVEVDEEDLTESDKHRHRALENASTLAGINPAAVVSRLSVSEPSHSALFPGGSVDLSLEANAIALRYLSDSQLSRLSLGGHAPQQIPAPSSSSTDSLLSPSNMSLATRKYMRRYGLIEEEDEEEEEAPICQPLTDTMNLKLLPQSQLIRDLRPKMKLLASGTKQDGKDKENCSGRRPSLIGAGSRQPEGSVGNILDLSRLRQLPKLF